MPRWRPSPPLAFSHLPSPSLAFQVRRLRGARCRGGGARLALAGRAQPSHRALRRGRQRPAPPGDCGLHAPCTMASCTTHHHAPCTMPQASPRTTHRASSTVRHHASCTHVPPAGEGRCAADHPVPPARHRLRHRPLSPVHGRRAQRRLHPLLQHPLHPRVEALARLHVARVHVCTCTHDERTHRHTCHVAQGTRCTWNMPRACCACTCACTCCACA